MNWRGWMQWAGDHQGRGLFLLFLMIGASPALFAPAAGVKLLKMTRGLHSPIFKYMAWFLIGTGFEVTCSLIANVDPPKGVIGSIAIHYSNWYTIWFWLGQFGRWLTAAILSWYIFYPSGKLIGKD